MSRSVFLVFLTALLCAACTGTLVKIAAEPPARYTTTAPGHGSACGVNLFGVIPIGVNDRAQRAYDMALQESGGTTLTDVKVTESWAWLYIGWRFCTEIEGLGVRPAS